MNEIMNKVRHLIVCLLLMVGSLPAMQSVSAIDPNDYPESRELLLGQVRVRVVPRAEWVVTAPQTGMMDLLIEPGFQSLSRNTPIAVLDRERIELEEALLAIESQLMDTSRRTDWVARRIQALEQAENSLAKAEAELQLVTRLKSDPVQAASFLPASGERAEEQRAEDLKRMRERAEYRIHTLRLHLEHLRDAQLESLEWQEQLLKLEQRMQVVARNRTAAELIMPFAGELEPLLPLRADEKQVPVRAGMDLFRIRDMSELFADAVVTAPEWRHQNTQQLFLRMRSGLHPFEGRFHSQRVEVSQRDEELIYRFKMQGEVNWMRGLTGGIQTADLMLNLSQNARIVPKLDVIRAATEAYRRGRYPGAVHAAMPGWRLLAIGEANLAIIPQEVN
jgi:hypothetical protein